VPGTDWHMPRTDGGATIRAMAKKQKKSGRGAARRGGGVTLASLTTEALAAELRRRRSILPKLEKRATALRGELAKLEAQIATLRGGEAPAPPPAAPRSARPATGRRTRGGRPTIGEQIAELLAARRSVMSPREIGTELGKSLGREVNANFLVQISLTLARLVKQGRVEKVGRGQYSAKGAAVDSQG